MRFDLYTKIVLTLILLLLAVNTLRPFVQPQPAMAQGNFSGVQFAIDMNGGVAFFDSQTGDIWAYSSEGGLYQGTGHRKLIQLGKPLVK
jgi:hypothetical protein